MLAFNWLHLGDRFIFDEILTNFDTLRPINCGKSGIWYCIFNFIPYSSAALEFGRARRGQTFRLFGFQPKS
jgi:hypothetical protein